MVQLIDKAAVVAKVEKWIELLTNEKNQEGASQIDKLSLGGRIAELQEVKAFLGTLEVKEDGDNYLEKFKSLQHIDKDLHRTLEDWGYAPNLYYFDGSWHVDWISCEEGDSIKGFEGNTPEDAIDKAYNWFHSIFCNG